MMKRETRRDAGGGVDVPRLALSILLCEAIGGIGSLFTLSSISNWYATILKPSFTPPNWLFGPIWITLFFLMGITFYLLWSRPREGITATMPLIAFGSQLVLNVVWTFLFFELHLLFVSLVEIVILWATIGVTIVTSYRVTKTGGLLLLPYIAWVTIASLLNYSVWVLNA